MTTNTDDNKEIDVEKELQRHKEQYNKRPSLKAKLITMEAENQISITLSLEIASRSDTSKQLNNHICITTSNYIYNLRASSTRINLIKVRWWFTVNTLQRLPTWSGEALPDLCLSYFQFITLFVAYY